MIVRNRLAVLFLTALVWFAVNGWITRTTVLAETPAPTAPPTIERQTGLRVRAASFAFVEIDSRIPTTDDVWSKYEWLLTLENLSSDVVILFADIQFLDENGTVAADFRATDLQLGAGETRTFQDYVVLGAKTADRFTGISASLHVRGRYPTETSVRATPTKIPAQTPGSETPYPEAPSTILGRLFDPAELDQVMHIVPFPPVNPDLTFLGRRITLPLPTAGATPTP